MNYSIINKYCPLCKEKLNSSFSSFIRCPIQIVGGISHFSIDIQDCIKSYATSKYFIDIYWKKDLIKIVPVHRNATFEDGVILEMPLIKLDFSDLDALNRKIEKLITFQ